MAMRHDPGPWLAPPAGCVCVWPLYDGVNQRKIANREAIPLSFARKTNARSNSQAIQQNYGRMDGTENDQCHKRKRDRVRLDAGCRILDCSLSTFEHVKLAPDRSCGPLWVQEQIAFGGALHDKHRRNVLPPYTTRQHRGIHIVVLAAAMVASF
jgi:hypothetical protein